MPFGHFFAEAAKNAPVDPSGWVLGKLDEHWTPTPASNKRVSARGEAGHISRVAALEGLRTGRRFAPNPADLEEPAKAEVRLRRTPLRRSSHSGDSRKFASPSTPTNQQSSHFELGINGAFE